MKANERKPFILSAFQLVWLRNSAPCVSLSVLKEQSSFFLVFLQTSYGFSLIKTYKLHYFYLILYSETTDRGEITVTTTFTSGLDLCIFPCFKYIVYQINSFALIAKWFPSIFIILVLFFVWNYRVYDHAHPRLRAPSWILNLKTLPQRFQVCYAQKHIREIWQCSFKRLNGKHGAGVPESEFRSRSLGVGALECSKEIWKTRSLTYYQREIWAL